MAIYQIHVNAALVLGILPEDIALGWFCDTQAEADMIAASLGGPGILGHNGIDRFHAAIGDLIRVRDSTQLQIIQPGGTLKKI